MAKNDFKKHIFKNLSLSDKFLIISQIVLGTINLVFGIINFNFYQILFGLMCILAGNYSFLIERQNALIDTLFIALELKEEDYDKNL